MGLRLLGLAPCLLLLYYYFSVLLLYCEAKCIEGVYDKYPECLFDNNAIRPTPKIETDWYDWWERHKLILEHKKSINPEIVLIGDSITHRWGGFPNDVGTGKKVWDDLFGHRRVLNLGFGWDRTQNVLWRLDHGEYDGLNPAYVVLNIGTNNLTPSEKTNTRSNSPYEIVEAIKLIIQFVERKTPEAKIIVMGVFPRDGKKYIRSIKELNERLSAYVSTLNNNVAFLDLFRKFANEWGSVYDDLLLDGVHPSEKGYYVWAKALEDLIKPKFWVSHKNSPGPPESDVLKS